MVRKKKLRRFCLERPKREIILRKSFFYTAIRMLIETYPIALLIVRVIEDAFEYLRIRIRKYLYLRNIALG